MDFCSSAGRPVLLTLSFLVVILPHVRAQSGADQLNDRANRLAAAGNLTAAVQTSR